MDVGSVEALAASADANGILINIAIIGYICLQIIAPLVSKAKAENNFSECYRLLKSNIIVALIMSVFCCVVVVIIGYNLEIFKQPTEIKILTQEYLWLMTLSTIPSFLFTAMKSFTDGLGYTQLGMKITFSALIMNIVLNYCFLNGIWFFPNWGLNGTGVATLISRIYMAIILAYFIFQKTTFKQYLQHKIPVRNLGRLIKNILKIGIPSGLQGFSEIAAFYGAVVMMGPHVLEEILHRNRGSIFV